MPLINCRECGKPVSTEATVCPNCGAPVNVAVPPIPHVPVAAPPYVPPVAPPASSTSRRLGPLIGGCVAGLVIAGIGLFVVFVLIAGAVASKQLTPTQKIVKQLQVSYRYSLLGDKTEVIDIANPTNTDVSFELKCYALNGTTKTIFVAVAAGQTSEVGILQGWQFQPGEHAEAIADNAVVWTTNVK